MQLILGSASPRRKELLQWTYLPFDTVTSDIEEHSDLKQVEKFVEDLALQKAQDVWEKVKDSYSEPVVLGADTIVVVDDEVLGKPKTKAQASLMLKKLSDRSHRVLTGVALLTADQTESFYDETIVTFDKISDDLLELYLATGESMDKAGAYGIQGAALGFISKVDGSYSNVVGLPVNLVLEKIEKIVSQKYGHDDNWRSRFEN